MKKCYNIKTWKKQKNVMISLNENYLSVLKSKTPYEKLDIKFEIEAYFYDKSTPTDPILAKLCKLTGAKMYGDYIIINNRYYKYLIIINCHHLEFWKRIKYLKF